MHHQYIINKLCHQHVTYPHVYCTKHTGGGIAGIQKSSTPTLSEGCFQGK